MKCCPGCGHSKPLTDFYAAKTPSGTSPYCKDCTRARQRSYGERNQEEISARRRAARQTPEGQTRERNRDWKRRYGVTYDEVMRMLQDQNGLCASCGDPVEIGKHMHVDHCHDTGRVRGVLCASCNLMIGHAKDDPKRLRLAAEYLER